MSFSWTGVPLDAVISELRMSSIERISPTPRTTAACGPNSMVWPPTLLFALLSAANTCGKVSPYDSTLSRFTVTS